MNKETPTLEFERIHPIRDPLLLGLDAAELKGLRRRLMREAVELIRTWLDVETKELINSADQEIPEFKFLGPVHDVASCCFMHIQEHRCGLAPPREMRCASARSIIDLHSSAALLRMGQVGAMLVKLGPLEQDLQSQTVRMAEALLAENTRERTFPDSARICSAAERVRDLLVHGSGALAALRRQVVLGPEDALDPRNRHAMWRSEAAFWALKNSSDDASGLLTEIRRRLVDVRKGEARKDHGIHGRLETERAFLEIRVRS